MSESESSSTPSYQWGHEHFCKPDATTLYNTEPQRLTDVGYPVELKEHPEPATFCSVCLEWFTNPQPEGSEPRPPQRKDSNG